MCNRYQLRTSASEVAHLFGVTREAVEDLIPSEYFPDSSVPIVKTADDTRELAPATWGIRLGKHRVTNSRDDKVGSTWRRFMHRRVVFPMSMAVEWRYPLDLYGQPTGKPAPWSLYPADESVAAVAGIACGGGDVSMMTCRAAGIAAEVHNKIPDDPRMVVFLAETADVDRWLDPDVDADDAMKLLRPAPDGWLAAEPLAKWAARQSRS